MKPQLIFCAAMLLALSACEQYGGTQSTDGMNDAAAAAAGASTDTDDTGGSGSGDTEQDREGERKGS